MKQFFTTTPVPFEVAVLLRSTSQPLVVLREHRGIVNVGLALIFLLFVLGVPIMLGRRVATVGAAAVTLDTIVLAAIWIVGVSMLLLRLDSVLFARALILDRDKRTAVFAKYICGIRWVAQEVAAEELTILIHPITVVGFGGVRWSGYGLVASSGDSRFPINAIRTKSRAIADLSALPDWAASRFHGDGAPVNAWGVLRF